MIIQHTCTRAVAMAAAIVHHECAISISCHGSHNPYCALAQIGEEDTPTCLLLAHTHSYPNLPIPCFSLSILSLSLSHTHKCMHACSRVCVRGLLPTCTLEGIHTEKGACACSCARSRADTCSINKTNADTCKSTTCKSTHKHVDDDNQAPMWPGTHRRLNSSFWYV